MDLLYFLRILLRRKWTILFLSILAAAGAFILVSFKKPLYESAAQYSTGFTAEKVRLTDGSAAVDIYTVDIKFNNVITTFKSPRVIGMLSYKLMLHDLENPEQAYRKLTPDQKNKPEYKAVNADTAMNILRKKILEFELLETSNSREQKILEFLKLYEYDYYSLRNKLIIRRVERTDYLDIVYQSENPKLSAYVVNNLGTEFLNYYKRLNEQRNTESAQNIRQILNIQQRKVDSLTNELKIARISQGALDPVEKTKNAMETVKELQIELSTAQSEYNLQSRLYQTWNERIKLLNSQISGGGSQDALSLFKKRDDLREQIAKATTPDPNLQRQLNAIEAQIREQSGSAANKTKIQTELNDVQGKAGEAKARMDAALATVEQLNRLITAAKGSSNVSPKTQVEIGAIDRQLEIENNELKSIREKLSQAEGLIRDDPTANFRQTLIGQPDIEPVPAKRIFTTGLAGMAVFVITSLIFLLIEIFDSSVKTPSQFNKMIRLKQTGVLNNINLKKKYIDEVVMNKEEPSQNRHSRELGFKNNIRKLRHEIEKTGKQVFLITSTQKKTGKTVVIQSLAQAFLLSNKKVLLLDMNFENNSLTETLNADHFIETIAQGKIPESINIKSLVSTTQYSNLFILGCRSGNHSPSEALSFDYLRFLIAEMKKEFDYIFIESASLNNRADSYELFQFAEGVITVFSASMVPSQSDAKSVEAIRNLGDKNFGAVLNNVKIENMTL
jgi:Mrp family chromosome partitioning ATPase